MAFTYIRPLSLPPILFAYVSAPHHLDRIANFSSLGSIILGFCLLVKCSIAAVLECGHLHSTQSRLAIICGCSYLFYL